MRRSGTGNVKVSARTVRYRLKEFSLNARISEKESLSPIQSLKRVNWAKTHVNWTIKHWTLLFGVMKR